MLLRASAFCLGGVLALALSYLPFAFSGRPGSHWVTQFFRGLSYAGSQLSELQVLGRHLAYIWQTATDLQHLTFGLSALVWVGGSVGLVMTALEWKKTPAIRRQALLICCLFFVGTGISILRGGAANPHYLIQLLPYMALGTAALVLGLGEKGFRWLGILLLLVAFSTAGVRTGRVYRDVMRAGRAQGTLLNGPAFGVADYLGRVNPAREPVYLMDLHIVYWLADLQPLSAAVVHPANISKEYQLRHLIGPGTTPASEMEKILAAGPKFILKPRSVSYLVDHPEVLAILEAALDSEYQQVADGGGFQIYQKF